MSASETGDPASIVEFLNARLDGDEEVARAAFSNQKDPENGWGEQGRAVTPHVGVIHEDAQRAHVARWNPARVLAEITAKRAIVQRWDRRWQEADDATEQRLHSMFASQATGLGSAVRLLASVYSDHPDYNEDWEP